MAKLRSWLLVSLFLTEALFLEAAKILTIATLGGSHYLVLSRVSQILQDNGHNVTQLLNTISHIPDFKKEKISYQVLNWHLPENQEKEFHNRLDLLSEELVHPRWRAPGLSSCGSLDAGGQDALVHFYQDAYLVSTDVKRSLEKCRRQESSDLEDFISKFGDSGFVLVALGSLVTLHQTKELIKEMNSAFARLPQGVLWTVKDDHWPKDVRLAPNVKIMDWVPQDDLLAHPSIRLFVTHGGMNSIMEAIQHGVPIVGIPFCTDQPENMIRIEVKKIGVSVQLETIKAETFALTLKEVIEDKRYKTAAMTARAIRRSHPLTPSQRLVGWIDHILQSGGGAHLKPHGFQQPWHVQYLLDVLLFLLGLTLATLWLLKKVLSLLLRTLCVARKKKKA
uniref:UDP-glucuronosyltransferase 3A1-like n=1 Tax=Myodes glareolus TaxID=447135 RepID=UPI002021B279|nr:UDP-glucuronosyltransferase 3A1-like [Myodes glareolus]